MFLKNLKLADTLMLASAFVLAIIAIEIIFTITPVFLIFFTAIILALAMERPINTLEILKIPRTLATTGLYASVFVGLIIILSITLPPLASELRNFISNYPIYSEAFLGNEDSIELQIMPYLRSFSESITGTSEVLIGTVFKTFGGITSLLAVFFIAFFLNIQKGGIRSFVYPFVSPTNQKKLGPFLDRVQDGVGNWLWGKTLSSFLVGFITLIGLLIFNIPYAFILAVLAMFLNFIPFIGPIIASIPAILLGFTQSLFIGIMVGIFYFLVNGVLESFIFGPLLMKRAIHVSPALLILFVISGAYLGGILGIIIAIPTAAIIYLSVCEYTGWTPSSFPTKKTEDGIPGR